MNAFTVIVCIFLAIAVTVLIYVGVWYHKEQKKEKEILNKMNKKSKQGSIKYWDSLLRSGDGKTITPTSTHDRYKVPKKHSRREIKHIEQTQDSYRIMTSTEDNPTVNEETYSKRNNYEITKSNCDSSYIIDATIYEFNRKTYEITHYDEPVFYVTDEFFNKLNASISSERCLLISVKNNDIRTSWFDNLKTCQKRIIVQMSELTGEQNVQMDDKNKARISINNDTYSWLIVENI